MSVYPLETVKQLVRLKKVRLGRRCIHEAFNEFGYSVDDICYAIENLSEFDYWNNRTYLGNPLPFDAYRKLLFSYRTKTHQLAYIKFQVDGPLIVVSFHTSDI